MACRAILWTWGFGGIQWQGALAAGYTATAVVGAFPLSTWGKTVVVAESLAPALPPLSQTG